MGQAAGAIRVALGLAAVASLTACADTGEVLTKVPVDHVPQQMAAASAMLRDQLQQLAAGDKRALKLPYYCVAVVNRDGKLQLEDAVIADLRSQLPNEVDAILVPEGKCPIVNQVYTLPTGPAANLLIAKWQEDADNREYWMAGIVGPGGLSGWGDNYWVSFTSDPPTIDRDTRWITF